MRRGELSTASAVTVGFAARRAAPPPADRAAMAAAAKRARVYFDVQIGARPPARVEFELFSEILPRTCENFRALCTVSYTHLTLPTILLV